MIASHRDGGIHMRASWIFSKNDVIANVGVIVAALLVAATNSRWPDLVIGAIITLFVLRGGISILQEAAAERTTKQTH
jgi:Co/Zn/Cd efflux system component